MPTITDSLEHWISENRLQIGEVLIIPLESGFGLHHFLDGDAPELKLYTDPDAGLEISRYDAQGNFRPLKSAPSLKRGWKMELSSLDELRLALDHLYPAALGTANALLSCRLSIVPLSETIQRQTGMYRVVNSLSTEQRDELAAKTCRSDIGCLKVILWQLAPDRPITTLSARKFDPACNQTGHNVPAIPIPCAEACNLLIAAGRTMAKAKT